MRAFEFPAIAQLVERPTVVDKQRSHRTVPGSNPGCRIFFIDPHRGLIDAQSRVLLEYTLKFDTALITANILKSFID